MMYLGNHPVSVNKTFVQGTKTATGTFTGSGTNVAEISCDFEPDVIYLYTDLSSDVSLRGVTSLMIVKDVALYETNDSSSSNSSEYASEIHKVIMGYNESNSADQCHATYSNGVLTIDTVVNSSSARFTSGVTYNYKLIGF